MSLEPVVLEGRHTRLVPLQPEHFRALHCQADPDVFEHNLDWPKDESYEAFAAWLQPFLAMRDGLAFAVLDAQSGAPVGVTTFSGYRSYDRAVEVGGTWYGAAARGTAINPEAKYLLLRHAFETLGLRRVQLKTSSENLRSQRAIARLGAVREGVLRNFQMRANGRSRDTVMFSVTDTEWPQVKARLEARLGARTLP